MRLTDGIAGQERSTPFVKAVTRFVAGVKTVSVTVYGLLLTCIAVRSISRYVREGEDASSVIVTG